MSDRTVRFALVGAGFIGRIHGLAIQAASRVFGEAPLRAEAAILIDQNAALAEAQARQLGFAAWTTDWETGIDKADAVVIATPSFMHREIAIGAASRGKHILCEKPVGRSVAEAEAIAAAAAKAGVTNGVGFTYMRAPMVRHAIDIVQSGLIGRPVSFRGWHAEDYLADAAAPFSWRLDASLAGRFGSLGDLGWHIIAVARALCGPIVSLGALTHTAYPQRRSGSDPARAVENEDWAAMLVRFRNGAVGTIESSRVAHGRKMAIGFELTCERGSIAFDGERANELSFYRADETVAVQGFRTIRIAGAHPHYAAFIPAPAHGLGFNDLKTIEIHAFLHAIAAGRNLSPDLDEACRIARICEAALTASADGSRIEAPEDGMTEPKAAA